jgi:hypothetical protein
LLLILTILYCLIWRVPFTGRSLLGELILTQNYIGSIWGHTWSLAVEEHFYYILAAARIGVLHASSQRDLTMPFRPDPYLFWDSQCRVSPPGLAMLYEHPSLRSPGPLRTVAICDSIPSFRRVSFRISTTSVPSFFERAIEQSLALPNRAL